MTFLLLLPLIGICRYTIPELLFVPKFYTGTYQYIIIIIFGMAALYEPQPSLEVKAAGYFFFGFPDNRIFTG